MCGVVQGGDVWLEIWAEDSQGVVFIVLTQTTYTISGGMVALSWVYWLNGKDREEFPTKASCIDRHALRGFSMGPWLGFLVGVGGGKGDGEKVPEARFLQKPCLGILQGEGGGGGGGAHFVFGEGTTITKLTSRG